MTADRTDRVMVAFGLCLAFLAAYQLFKLPPVLPVLLETYGYDRTLAGGFMSVYALAGLSLSVWLARVFERRGIAGPVIVALCFMLAGNGLALLWPGSGWLLLCARALEGIAFAILAIAGPLLANTAASARHLPIVIGLTATWIPMGQLTAALMAPAALALQGWQALWLVAMVPTLLLAIWTFRLRATGRIQAPRPPDAGATRSGPRASITRRERVGLLLAAAIFMCWSCQFFAYMTWLPQYLVEVVGLSVSSASAGYLLPVAVVLLCNMLAATLLRMGVPLGGLLTTALAAQAAVWWLQPLADDGWSGIAALVAYGVGAGVTPTCLFAMPSAISGTARSAPAFGIIMTGRNIGVLLGPVLLAQAYQIAGTWDISVPIFGGISLIALAIAALLAARLATERS